MSIQAYNIKAIVSGGVYEFYRYDDTMFRGYERKRRTGAFDTFHDSEGNPVVIDKETGEMIPKKLNSRARSNIRARNELRRLALSNFNNKSKFITLTFKANMTDLTEANHLFGEFIKRLRKIQPDLKYIVVIEFTKIGRIHYHVLCNLKYMRAKKLEDLWGQGFIKINRITHVDNIGAYVIKYMTKEDADPRLIGKKMYQTSRNLDKPKELIGAEAQYLWERMQIEKRKKVYSSSYENKQTTNKIIYEEYNLARK